MYAGEEDDHGYFEASENLLSFTQAAAHEASSQNDDAGEQGVQPHLITVLIVHMLILFCHDCSRVKRV